MIPTKDEKDGTSFPKIEDESNEIDLEQVAKNYRSTNLIYCGLDANEYNRITSCKTAKEIWDRLEVTCEGIAQVKETKIIISIRRYELFKMNIYKSIMECFSALLISPTNLIF